MKPETIRRIHAIAVEFGLVAVGCYLWFTGDENTRNGIIIVACVVAGFAWNSVCRRIEAAILRRAEERYQLNKKRRAA